MFDKGISASIAGGSISMMYFLLHCDGIARILWLSLLGISNLVGFFGPSFKVWYGPHFRFYRTTTFLCSAGSVIGPILYYFFKYGNTHLPDSRENPAFVYLGMMMLQYLAGAFFYALRIPERLFELTRFSPGSFDYLLHSHQIWHMFVITATLTLYRGIIGLIIWRIENDTMCN